MIVQEFDPFAFEYQYKPFFGATQATYPLNITHCCSLAAIQRASGTCLHTVSHVDPETEL